MLCSAQVLYDIVSFTASQARASQYRYDADHALAHNTVSVLHDTKLCCLGMVHGTLPKKLPGALLTSDLDVGDLVLLVNALEDSCKDLVWSNLVALLQSAAQEQVHALLPLYW